MKRIVWDQEKCTGCRVCEGVCSLAKEGEANPVKSRCKVLRTVKDSLLYKVRVACLQCEEPHCMAVCPAGAISVNEEHVKVVDESKCLGCKMCEIACPVGAISVCSDKGVALKCDQCQEYPEPKCVKYCFVEALQYLPDERVGTMLARSKSERFLELNKKEA